MITAPELQAFIDTRNRFSEDKLQFLTFDGVQFAESVDQNGGAVRIQIEQMRYHYSLFDDNPRLDAILPPEVRRRFDSDMYPLAAIISERSLTLSSVLKPSIRTILLFRVCDWPYDGMFTPKQNQVALLKQSSYSEIWSWTAPRETFVIKRLLLVLLHPYRIIGLEY